MFKSIPGYPKYKISEDGIVISPRNKRISVILGFKGYMNVSFRDNNGNHKMNLHRVLALTFIPNPNNLPQVNHIDGNKLNNSLSNLEWVTNSQNIQHAYDTGLMKNTLAALSNRKRILKPILRYDMNGRLIAQYPSVKEAAAKNGISACLISSAATGRIKSSGGSRWAFSGTIAHNFGYIN